MKKIKLLAPILSVITFSSAIAPLVGCSSGKKEEESKGTIELSDTVKGLQITVAKSYICKNKDSWFTLNLPEGKEIKSIAIDIGNSEIYTSEVKIEGNKVTIPSNKMIASDVIVKSIGFELPVIISIKVSPNSLTKDANSQLTANDLSVTLEYNDDTKKKDAVYGTDYKVYAESGAEVTLPYTIQGTPGSTSNLIIKSVNNLTITTKLEIKVAIKVTSIEITNTETELNKGDYLLLKANVLPEAATNKNLDWTITSGSEYAEIKTVGDVSYLIAKDYGNVKVKATAKDGSGVSSSEKQFEIKSEIKVTSVTITNTETELTKFTWLDLHASVLPEHATNKNLDWTILTGHEYAEIKTVDGCPILVAKDPGDITQKATVKATAKDGSDKSAEKEFNIKPDAKTVTLEYDTDSFGAVAIQVDESSSKTISNDTKDKSKISIKCYRKGSKPINGLIQIYAGAELIQETDVSTIQPTSIQSDPIVIDFNKWDSIGSEEKLIIKFCGSYFNTKSWNKVSKACKSFEVNASKSVENAKKLCEALGFDTSKTTKTTAKEILEEQLVGKIGQVLINNKQHTVRVIDVMHDAMMDDVGKITTTAAITFEMATVLSDINGNSILCNWDPNSNYDYLNSRLRKNLTGEGTSSVKWESSETRTALQMLPSELQSSIRPVNKKIAIYNPETSQFEVKEAGYNDKLFPLTCTEIGEKLDEETPEFKIEGFIYKYYQTNKASRNQRRIKQNFNGNACFYFLATSYIDTSIPQLRNTIYAVTYDGSAEIYDCDHNAKAVSFGFCI